VRYAAGPVLAADVYWNTPPWVHFKLYPNAFGIHVIVSIDSKALEMALVRACTRGAAGGASLSGSSDLVRTLGHLNAARSRGHFRNHYLPIISELIRSLVMPVKSPLVRENKCPLEQGPFQIP
jgi:hypothetical protein